MRHRIYTPDTPVPGTELTITGDELHHAVRVVRLRVAEPVEIFDGRGGAARGVVLSVDASALRILVEETIPARESPLDLTLAMSIIQLEKFEWVLQKATELGVRAIVPLVSDRVEIRPERYRGKAERWEKIVFEAAKQSGRAVLPRLETPLSFDALLDRDGTKIVFDGDVTGSAESEDCNGSQILLIGPEGGFSERELELARKRDCRFGWLGPRRLRAETAAIVACTVAAALRGDLRR